LLTIVVAAAHGIATTMSGGAGVVYEPATSSTGLDNFQDSNALQKVVLKWTKENFSSMYAKNAEVGKNCMNDRIEYDAANSRLVRIFSGMPGEVPEQRFFTLDPLPPPPAPPVAPPAP
jgi:hypothetical protein